MSNLCNPTIEAWLLEETKLYLTSKMKLSGKVSLYQSFVNYCQLREVSPVELRAFSKVVESLITQHFKVLSPKTRDQRGIFFKGIQLKSGTSHITL